jgi:hypothetical protein
MLLTVITVNNSTLNGFPSIERLAYLTCRYVIVQMVFLKSFTSKKCFMLSVQMYFQTISFPFRGYEFLFLSIHLQQHQHQGKMRFLSSSRVVILSRCFRVFTVVFDLDRALQTDFTRVFNRDGFLIWSWIADGRVGFLIDSSVMLLCGESFANRSTY